MTTKRDSKKSLLAFIGAAVAILGAIPALLVAPLYLAGLMYELGYMSTYGVSSELFPRSLHDYLAYAYYGSVRLCTDALQLFLEWPLLIGALIFAVIATLLGLDKLTTHLAERAPKEAIRSCVNRMLNSRVGAWFFPSFFVSCMVWAIPYVLVTVLALVLIAPFLYHSAGGRAARAQIEAFKTCDMKAAPTGSCARILRNGVPLAAGWIIAKGEGHIALYDGKTVRLYPIAEDVIEVRPKAN
jgi:hypothetical protein